MSFIVRVLKKVAPRESSSVMMNLESFAVEQIPSTGLTKRECSCPEHGIYKRIVLLPVVQPQLDIDAICCSVEQLGLLSTDSASRLVNPVRGCLLTLG
jgi:hypothetical protein